MDKPCDKMAVAVPAVADAHAQSPLPEQAAGDQNSRAVDGLGRLIRALALAVVTYSFAVTAWQARQEPWILAFIFGAYAALAALLLCLRRAEQLTPTSPAGERRRVQAAVWALSTVLSCTFAYRVSLLMPVTLVFVIWCMTSSVVLFGFYMLVLCKDQHYQTVDVADDGKALIKKFRLTDEMV